MLAHRMSEPVKVSQYESALGEALSIEDYCSERGYPFSDLAPVVKVDAGFGKAREFVAYVENVQVFSEGFLAIPGGTMIRGLSQANYGHGIAAKLIGVERRDSEDEIEEAVLCWGDRNFGHFIFQYLTRMAQCMAMPFLLDKPVLLKRGLPDSYKEWLRRLGFTRFVEADEWVKVKRLWVPAICNYRGHYEDMTPYLSTKSCFTVRGKLLAGQGAGPELVYITRRNAAHRKVLNESELIAALEGFTVVDMEGMSVQAQVDTVASAKVIVLSAGASSPITMFAPKECKVVELTNAHLKGIFGSVAWAYLIGQDFRQFRGETVEEGPEKEKINRNFRVDVGAVKREVFGELELEAA